MSPLDKFHSAKLGQQAASPYLNAEPRSEAAVKAARLLPMTKEEIASLSDAELVRLEKEARLRKLFHECDDACLTESERRELSTCRALQYAAEDEQDRRLGKQVAAE